MQKNQFINVAKNLRLEVIKQGLRILIGCGGHFKSWKRKNEGRTFDIEFKVSMFFVMPSLGRFIEKCQQAAVYICRRIDRNTPQEQAIALTTVYVFNLALLIWVAWGFVKIFKLIF